MGKIIDADVFYSILRDAQAECKKNGGNFRFGVLKSVMANLANQPSVDAVPVVRCKDCKHYNTTGYSDGFGWCEDNVVNTGTWDDFYCARGKRRDSE